MKIHYAIKANPYAPLVGQMSKYVDGFDAENIAEIIQTLNFDWVNLKGLHIFTDSQNLNSKALIQAQTNTFELAYQILQ